MVRNTITVRCASNATIVAALIIILRDTSVSCKNLIASIMKEKYQADTRIVIRAPMAAETAGIAISLYIIPNNCL